MLLKNKFIRLVKTRVMHRWPKLYICGTRWAARHWFFGRERTYLKGARLSRSEAASVVFFAYNRCGSMYVSELIRRLTAPAGLAPIDLGRYFFHAEPGGTYQLEDKNFWQTVIEPRGYVYGPFRHVVACEALEATRIVLVLRDPRDVLTSRFYSMAYSHSPKDDVYLETRERAQAQGIDAFVIEKLPEVLSRYQSFQREIVGRKNVLFLRYEDMVGEFPEWLGRLALHVCDEPQPELVKQLIGESNFQVGEEDKYAHRRAVQPGNYRSKLKAETVAAVEREFGPVMNALGYQVDIGNI